MPYFTQTPHSFLPLPTIKDAYRKFEIKITFRPDSADGEQERGCFGGPGAGISWRNHHYCLSPGGPQSYPPPSDPCPGTPRPDLWVLSRASSCLHPPLRSTSYLCHGLTPTHPPVLASCSASPPPSLFCLHFSAFPPLSLSLSLLHLLWVSDFHCPGLLLYSGESLPSSPPSGRPSSVSEASSISL